MVANFRPRCPPGNVYLGFGGSGVYPAGGGGMRPKSPPEAVGCDPSLCRRLDFVSKTSLCLPWRPWSVCMTEPLAMHPGTETCGVLVTDGKHMSTQQKPRQWYHRRLSALQ